jgi:hypothetical protein
MALELLAITTAPSAATVLVFYNRNGFTLTLRCCGCFFVRQPPEVCAQGYENNLFAFSSSHYLKKD